MEIIDLVNQLSHYNKPNILLKKKSKVSAVGVDWHLYHSILSINKICEALLISNPNLFMSHFNIKWWIIKMIKKFPRGKAKAPKYVTNFGTIDQVIVDMEIEKSYQLLIDIDQLSTKHYFKHFVFGDLPLNDAKKLMMIHTQHHIDIIEDIIRN
ncbi:hypothetical protein [Flammeovirga pacifica]|uniref:DUF1569 domain-containing protein n=1 Tax=Flammeovirga pacifica TaxID=915059 RepID=A0A1S1YST7_FLAPC|nr:hypothetical protein [Flammeovirga pacifica]OHX64091.1 hypothetical protein NH26_21020 [Flammeovirga pacifica]